MKNSKLSKIAPEANEAKFREMATKGPVCQSQTCPVRERCLRFILNVYVPENQIVVNDINLRNPKMQKDDCPKFSPDAPVRMPLGLKQMYYDMPHHIERAVKNHLISLFTRKRYYEYHNGQRPVTPDIEATIRQTLLAAGWTQEPTFDGYVEEYLW